MSYKTLIDNQVNKVFNLVGDLADDVTLVKNASTFDFADGSVDVTSENITTKMIVTEISKNSDSKNTMKKTVVLKTKDVGDIKAYDYLTHDGVDWKIGSVILSERFTTVVELYREV